MKLKFLTAALAVICSVSFTSAKEKIFVNSDVTTHIVMPENIKMVDISTSKIAGNQCADNIVRIKPFIEGQDESDPDLRPAHYREQELIGTVTLIGERHLAQYDVVYTSNPQRAASIIHIPYSQMESYINPDVSMPESEMARYAWAVYGSDRKYNQIVSKKHGMKAVVNNIYSVGNYFFIDYSLENKTKIPYAIDEMRVKLVDRKEVKATNSQSVELTPAFTLNLAKKFKKNYRNVLVLPKLTFPDEKMLTLEISENQISGRVITMTIHYEDILNADAFDTDILNKTPYHNQTHIYTAK
ncbi:MAG: conjugative transposon protein TraN [Bacteroidales bacterium]|nr:conjugative transposon protein TraN [Bacteroidales bacterium]